MRALNVLKRLFLGLPLVSRLRTPRIRTITIVWGTRERQRGMLVRIPVTSQRKKDKHH